MQSNIPSIGSPTKIQKKRTGPHTAAGKARSCKNATKHGLTSRSLIQPGEDPQEYDQFIADVIKSLHPVGATEEELARQFATANWKLRRIERWEVAQAHGQAASEQKQIYQAHLAALSEQVQKERSDLRQLQEDPASDPPLILQIASRPENCPICGLQVNRMFQIGSIALDRISSTLADFAKRIESLEMIPEPPGSRKTDSHGAITHKVKSRIPLSGNTAGPYVKRECWLLKWPRVLESRRAAPAASQWTVVWRAPGSACGSRHRRNESRRKIKNLEFQQQNLRVEQTVPDAPRLELLTLKAAIRARDKSLNCSSNSRTAEARRSRLALQQMDWAQAHHETGAAFRKIARGAARLKERIGATRRLNGRLRVPMGGSNSSKLPSEWKGQSTAGSRMARSPIIEWARIS